MTKGEAQEEAQHELVDNLMLVEGSLKQFSGGSHILEERHWDFWTLLSFLFLSQGGSIHLKFKIPLDDKCRACLKALIKACIERDSIKKLLPPLDKILKEYAIEVKKKCVRV